MNKEQLIARVRNIPLFEKRKVWVENFDKEPGAPETVPDMYHEAICEQGKNAALTYVGPRYYIAQFSDVFMPVLAGFDGEVDGNLIVEGGFAALFLFPEDESLKTDKGTFGIVTMNSVDCSSAISVRFCIDYGGTRYTIPHNVSGIKKNHTKSSVNLVRDYMGMIGPVKTLWHTIITEFPKYKMVMRDMDASEFAFTMESIRKKFKLGPRLYKAVMGKYETATLNGREYTLWDVFVDSFEVLSNKNYKTEAHKQKRIDKLSQTVFEYAAVIHL